MDVYPSNKILFSREKGSVTWMSPGKYAEYRQPIPKVTYHATAFI